MTPFAETAALRVLATAAQGRGPCETCAPLACKAWETLPGGFDERLLREVASLRADPDTEPTVAEYHPQGTRLWSPDAPIAPAYHPYNRSGIWACSGCGRAFLRYTEYGGYYVDQRIRELDPALVVDAPRPPQA